ncbi:MAG TPA: tryptophanase [Candidatus Lachnoclostridium stercoravium]|uniref:Tryptophanase n=1 Tax=Candidatus Lachnoclostridium stercoravium TaxID=2838633 RepID=A0A9D2HIP9_9FIRM|nr:tryptophanase [Candidatus Lachnoclostridium stercoravium]
MAVFLAEPYKIKVVEPIKVTTREYREQAIKEAGYNMFRLKSEDVYVDTLTDSGTNAMSAEQWSALMHGDEAYAGAASYYRLIAAAKDIFGYGFFQPVHQGRAAEKVLFPSFLEKGKYAIANLFFDTTRAHVELAGARCLECCNPEAADTQLKAPFKGNMDVEKLEKIITEKGPENIGMVVMTITNNSAGGQPVSLQNMRDTAAICQKYHIHLNIDAARFAENAMFVKLREPECKDMSIKEITRAFFDLADTFTMSAKKDAIVNMGGLIGVKDEEAPYILKIKANCISFEGFYTYGGLNGRDLDAMAVGLYEGMDENWLRYRLATMEYFGERLDEYGIPYQSPAGGHGIFLDAAKFYPQIPYNEFPGQVLSIELYKECGLRGCDIGSFMIGNDPDTGKQLKSINEFTRLAIPRRVYTQTHYDMVIEAINEVWKKRETIKRGYRITWEPPILRHFQATLEPIE